MTVEQVKAMKNAIPFVPFRIHYPGGSPVDVPHPDYMSFSATGRIAYVSLPDERLIRIDVALITSLEELQPASR
jgi:hypothetical protein